MCGKEKFYKREEGVYAEYREGAGEMDKMDKMDKMDMAQEYE